MNKKTIMVIDIPFNTAKHPFWPEFDNMNLYEFSKKDSQQKEWIDYRIGIFMKYTLSSLKNQTNQDFICVLRYSKETESLILDALSKHEKLPENIAFTSDGDQYIAQAIEGYKYIYHIRLDSDNMYSKDFIEQLHNIDYYEELQCILCQKGYMYDVENGRIAEMIHGSPSFYALVYTVDDFLCGFQHYVEMDHWGAAKLVNVKINTHSFFIIIHGKNLSNNFNLILDYPFIETRVLEEEEKKAALNSFDLI